MGFGVYDHFVTQHSWFKFYLKPAFLTSYNKFNTGYKGQAILS